VQRGPCACGEHTREILREAGFSDDEVDALVEEKAVLDEPVVAR
jgi:crotonobetainyl-CoA:carnitine CoA-transferase CaiB-like acyl-CoA transferase